MSLPRRRAGHMITSSSFCSSSGPLPPGTGECRTYDRKLFRLPHVLREFHSKKKVNTRELANAFNVSIGRCRGIWSYCSLGECIDYDCAQTPTPFRMWTSIIAP